MFRGFKDFITRGNVIDLAVAVVIGTAFAALVDQLTKSFLDPLIRVIFGGGTNGGAFFVRGQRFDYGAFISPQGHDFRKGGPVDANFRRRSVARMLAAPAGTPSGQDRGGGLAARPVTRDRHPSAAADRR